MAPIQSPWLDIGFGSSGPTQTCNASTCSIAVLTLLASGSPEVVCSGDLFIDLHSVFYGCLMIKNCCFAVPTGLVDEKLPLASNVPLVSTSQLPNGVVRLVVVRTW